MTELPHDNHDAAADQATDDQVTDDQVTDGDELFEPGEALLPAGPPHGHPDNGKRWPHVG